MTYSPVSVSSGTSVSTLIGIWCKRQGLEVDFNPSNQMYTLSHPDKHFTVGGVLYEPKETAFFEFKEIETIPDIQVLAQ